jgi:3-deoxy-D-manno-octulosonate 8-phosphate phosphatase KdsC-like HAD superfamily phosphatase
MQKMTFVLQKEEAERVIERSKVLLITSVISTGLSDKQLQYEQIKAQKELAASTNTKIIFMNGK